MALEIIGAGFGRTGTLSTFAALKQFGFPCYHMQEVVLNKANKGHLEFWRRIDVLARHLQRMQSLRG